MRQEATLVNTMRCNLMMTNKSRKGIQEWSTDEHTFFNIQRSFEVHIEKRPVNSHGNISLSLYFDNVTNTVLAEKLTGRVVVMECILQHDGLLATGFHVRGGKVPVRTNRRLSVDLAFVTARNNGAGMPIQLHTKIRELPVAEERSEYVKKRISSWEGYLKIQERNADIADITASYSKLQFNEDFSRLTLIGSNVNANEWNKIKGLSVTLKGFQNDVGEVLKIDRNKKAVEIEIKPRFREMARRNQWHPKLKEAVFSNFATLSQIRRLRKGFEDLQNGLAANANLEKILFEDRPAIRITSKKEKLEFHNQLNEFQQEAVIGAMSAEDLYVIQGPPGTGKTTVISEICQQNAKAGLKTLVASQSNLAVDNALGRLLSNKDIRILRFGRTESIEEEGKKFIEENVGQYWKDQTLSVLQKEIDAHDIKEGQLTEELTNCDKQIQLLENKLIVLEESINQKKNAREQHAEISNGIKQLKKSLVQLKKGREELENSLQMLQKTSNELTNELKQMQQYIESNPTSQQLIEQIDQLDLEMKQIRHEILYYETTQALKQMEATIMTTRESYQASQMKAKSLEELLSEIQSIRKLDVLKSRMNDYEIELSPMLLQQMTELDQLIEKIKSFTEWQDVNTRLLSAIDYLEGLLRKYNFSVENVKNNIGRSGTVFHSSYTVKEIHQFIDIMKQMLTSRNEEINIEKFTIYLEGLYVRKNFVWKQGDVFQQAKINSTKNFQTIKLQIAEQVKKTKMTIEQTINELRNNGITKKVQLQQLQGKLVEIKSQIGPISNISSVHRLQADLSEKEQVRINLKGIEKNLTNYVNQLEMKKNKLKVTVEQIEESVTALREKEKESRQVNSEGLEHERQLKELDEILKRNPEEERERTIREINFLSEKVVSLQREKDRLPIAQSLQNEWFSLLQDANDHDLDEIRKLYVRHANVIGTTCVASARKEFMENYPTFDVVIIDEVSKATPPELLLPMLKGKKIILVGDHHQLPPLVGEDTLDETLKVILEESNDFEEKEELKKLLKESLFERLFKNLPKSNKTMLAIQYRMHESIMETITPFYEEENYRLQCGLTDSDTVRDHLLESHYVKRRDHLLWINMPNEKKYFEDRMKDGKSRFNQSELDEIRDVLVDLDKATAIAINEGRINPDERKSIGVISFYGEQVKRIDRLIQQELSLKHLSLRTGTVDKFQGMEMDVIILSMVRNNQDKSGDIGFANDYRRLNVALSRARELLVLVGSAEMFTRRAKQKNARDMYGRLLRIVKDKNGFRDHKGN